MNTKKQLYSFTIQPQGVDFQCRTTLATLGNILLTAAGYNADDNGFGSRLLNEMQCSWVLTKFAVEMNVFPLQYEEIEVETWVEDIGKLSTTRNFRIYNKQGEIIGNASSLWVMIHLDTRKPQDLTLLGNIENAANHIACDIEKPIRLKAIAGKLMDSFKVKYCDIDINKHTNTVRYIEWICNCFPLEMYSRKHIKHFEINFIHEILFDEQVNVFCEETEPGDYRFEIKKEDSVACKARVIWE